MFGGFKDFISSLSADASAREEERASHDCRLAAAALLFHVADLDGAIQGPEKARLRSLISDRFGLDATQTSRLIVEAKTVDREAVDLFHFTSVLNRALDHEGRLKVVEMMWEMAYVDGKADELEETTIWRVAELLGVSTRERVTLRQNVAQHSDGQESEQEPDAAALASPWTSKDES